MDGLAAELDDFARFIDLMAKKGKHSGNSIRLVELLPGSTKDPIACSLSQYALHRRPPHAAVSYMWGNLRCY